VSASTQVPEQGHTRLPVYPKPQQVAERYSVHLKTVLRWCERGKIPHLRQPGGQLRFPLERLEMFQAQRTDGTRYHVRSAAKAASREQPASA
jgi:excisionase family DNA binding protein